MLTPYDIFALRLITASLVLLPFARSMPTGAWRDRRLWLLTMLCSLFYCPLAYNGFKYAPASHGGILLSGLQPFLISIVAWLIVGTRPNRMRCIGLGFIAVGVVCAAMPYFSVWSADSVFGDALILLSSIPVGVLWRAGSPLGVFGVDADTRRGIWLGHRLSAHLRFMVTQGTVGRTALDAGHSEFFPGHCRPPFWPC